MLVLEIIVILVIFVLFFMRKNNPSENKQENQVRKNLYEGMNPKELTTAPNENIDIGEEEKAQLQKMISAPSPSISENENKNSQGLEDSGKTKPKEEPIMSKEIEEMLTAPK